MENKIVEKVKKELFEGIKTEKDVVYLMVLIRKLLEKKNKKPNYPLLNFYCNWALHIKIDKLSPAQEILKKIAQRHNENGFRFAAREIVDEIAGLRKFKKQIKLFLKKMDIPIEFFENNRKWFEFKKLLVDILRDSPLIGKVDPVEKFIFKPPTKNSDEDKFRFGFEIKFPADPILYKGGFTEKLVE